MSDVKVKFSAEDDGLSKTLLKTQKELNNIEKQSAETNSKFSASFKGMAAAAAGVAVGIGALKLGFSAVTGTAAAFGEALDMGGRLADLSARTGESAGKVLLLERAFANAGSSAEKVGPTINKLQKFIDDASDSGSEQAKTMARLGLTYENLKSQSPVEQLRMTAEAIAGVDDDGTRAALAMKVFGKSGGELLPFLRDFGNGLSGAKEELGRMVGIMDAKSAVFDTVSDKIAIVKGKLTEFAAGILSKTVPALELLFTSLARIDAAAIGERLANAFLGGQAAMDGFSAALSAMRIGEFSLSFEIAFASIKLQIKQTANEIYKNMVAAFESSAKFLVYILGPGSAVMTVLKESFKIISETISISIGTAISKSLGSLPMIGDEIKDGVRIGMIESENQIANSKLVISAYAGQIGEDFKEAGKAFPQSFKSAYESTKPLIEITKDLERVAKLQEEIDFRSMFSGQKQPAPFKKNNEPSGDEKARIENLEKIKQLEIEIADAKASGNKELEDLLNAQLAAAKQFERSIANGKTFQEATTASGVAYAVSISNAAKESTKVTKELKEQLSLSEKLSQSIEDFREKEKIDPGGKLEKKFNDALAEGDPDKAERIRKRIADREQDSDLSDNLNKGRALGKSLKDIAKEKGIDTFRKSDKELRDELNKKLGGDLNKPGEDKRDNNRRGGQAPDGAKDPLTAIQSAVEEIRKLVSKIEPKLPTVALAQ